MKINKATLYHVQLPMKFVFNTAKTSLKLRDTLIIKLEDDQENQGYGECVSFVDPFYTSETLESSWKVLTQIYLPNLLETELSEPFEIHQRFERPLPMAISGLENALLDLYYSSKNQNIIQSLFNEPMNKKIARGAVLGEMNYKNLTDNIDKLIGQGVQRIKLKISPKTNFEELRKIIKAFPEVTFAVDANQSFSLENWYKLLPFDELDFACIEEPFSTNNIADLMDIKTHFQTPFCFDESVQNFEDLQQLPLLAGENWLNIKIGRLGGLYQTKQAINFCRQNNIKFWIGSMVESGISKILHVQLAALSDNIMAGDLSDSQHYFEEDLIIPEIEFKNGEMEVPTNIGLGVQINERALEHYTIAKEIFQ